jgi:hypothetical protein
MVQVSTFADSQDSRFALQGTRKQAAARVHPSEVAGPRDMRAALRLAFPLLQLQFQCVTSLNWSAISATRFLPWD